MLFVAQETSWRCAPAPASKVIEQREVQVSEVRGRPKNWIHCLVGKLTAPNDDPIAGKVPKTGSHILRPAPQTLRVPEHRPRVDNRGDNDDTDDRPAASIAAVPGYAAMIKQRCEQQEQCNQRDINTRDTGAPEKTGRIDSPQTQDPHPDFAPARAHQREKQGGQYNWQQLVGRPAFTVATDVQVYFCDRSSPRQRGSNENTTGLLRQYYLKRADLSAVTQAQLDAVAKKLNTRPRGSHNWKTPAYTLGSSVSMTH